MDPRQELADRRLSLLRVKVSPAVSGACSEARPGTDKTLRWSVGRRGVLLQKDVDAKAHFEAAQAAEDALRRGWIEQRLPALHSLAHSCRVFPTELNTHARSVDALDGLNDAKPITKNVGGFRFAQPTLRSNHCPDAATVSISCRRQVKPS